jgi:hypothetical protein
MSECGRHRRYLPALADGELDLFPVAVLRHVRSCPDCGREVETHRTLTRRLRTAMRPEPAQVVFASALPIGRLPRAWAAAAAALVVVAVLGGLGAWRLTTGPDQVASTAALARQGPQLHSRDDATIGAWCERASDRPMPPVSLPSLAPVGARVDRLDGDRVVTISYVTTAGERVTVSWLDASSVPSSGRRIEARSVGGRSVLAVRSRAGLAVVTGDASPRTLRATAADFE